MSVIGKSRTIQRTAPWVLTLALVWPAAALAQKKGKHGEAEVDAVQTARTKIEKSTGQAIIKQPKIDTNYIVRNVQTKMAKINDQLIGKLQRLIRITEDTDTEKPDLMFRLAELFAEKQRYYTFRAGEMDEKIGSARSPSQKQGYLSEKKGFEDQERYWLLEAVKIYIEICNSPKFKKYPKMDEVLFYLAYMLQQVRREEQARVFFQRLIKDHPSSKFIPDAYMSFGVYYFQTGDMDSARKIFDRVTQFKESRVYGYAMFLKAWCWYNLSQYKKSLETFEQVIEIARAQRKTNKLAPTLERDSKMNMVLPYSRVEPIEVGAAKAWNYFRRFGGEMAPKMHERLAEVYWEQGRYKLSTQVYHELMRNFPASQSFCNWQYSIVRNTISTGQLRDQVQELQRLSAVWEYARDKKFLKPDKFEECEQNTQAMLHELATVWHKTGQKTENVTYYDLAQHLYREYITKFPKSKDAGLMTYYYGDLLFMLANKSGDAKKWQEAAEIFTRAVKADASGNIKVKTRDGLKVMRNEAAFAAVFCWMKALKLEEEVSGEQEKEDVRKKEAERKKGKAKGKAKEEDLYKPLPIPKKQLLMLEAFETYLRLVPKAPERIRIHYQKARIFYEANQFDKAAPIFAEIATQYKTDPLAVVAANLLLNCLEHQKKITEIGQWVEKFLLAPELTKDAEFKKVLDTIKAGIEWKKCEEFEGKKEYKQAGLCQNELVEKYPTDPRVPTLLHDMGVNFMRAKLVGNAMKARQALVDLAEDKCRKGDTKMCKNPLAQKAQFQLGQSYMELAFFESAAKYFENFANKYGGEKEAPQALSTAVFFRRGLGQDNKAIEDSREFVKFYGRGGKAADKPAAAAVEFSIGQIFETQKNWDKVVKHYSQYLKEWAKFGGDDRAILAHVKIGEVQWRQSCPVAGVNGACIDVKRVSAGGKASIMKVGKGKKARVKGRTQCGPETKSKITLHARKGALAKAAQEHFASALKLFATSKGKVGGKDPADKAAREAEMLHAVAAAKFLQVEASYEKFLGIQVPTGLDFDTDPKKKKKAEESTKKFTKWFEDKSKTLGKLSDDYQSVITLKQAHWAIAALARIGQLYQNYADQLYTVEIPKAPKAPFGMKQEEFDEMFATNYCDALVDQVEKWKLVPKASEGFTKCLNKSTELFWYNEWSGLCEQELNQLDPRSYPMAIEIRAQPGYVEAKVEEAKAVLDVKQ
jgi:tetratricopeptide (TPR) repeat protein